MSLDAAVAQVEHDAPPPMDMASHPLSLAGLGELLSEREQGEVPAA